MSVSSVHHTGLTVASMATSLDFYAGMLGCEVVNRRVIDQPWLAALLGEEAAVVDAADLVAPGSNHVIQLFEFSAPSAAPVAPSMPAPGSVHIAMAVAGLGELLDRLAAAGYEPLAPPVTITSGANTGGTLVCVPDPDGVIVEFFEAPAPSG